MAPCGSVGNGAAAPNGEEHPGVVLCGKTPPYAVALAKAEGEGAGGVLDDDVSACHCLSDVACAWIDVIEPLS